MAITVNILNAKLGPGQSQIFPAPSRPGLRWGHPTLLRYMDIMDIIWINYD